MVGSTTQTVQEVWSTVTLTVVYLQEMYCLDCSVTACRRCLAAEHKSHRAGEVERLGSQLRERIRTDVVRMQQNTTSCRADLRTLRRIRDQFETR